MDVEDDDGFFVGVGVDGVVGGGVMRKRFGIFVIFEKEQLVLLQQLEEKTGKVLVAYKH